jgi:PiT family inorganic phosphate transporter
MLLIVAAAVGAYMAMNIGANDVANNVGPAVGSGVLTLVAALAIAAVFEADPMRAFCIAMAATITVIVASQLGLPVSTTHVAVGGVFGVGFLRASSPTSRRIIRRAIRPPSTSSCCASRRLPSKSEAHCCAS